MYGITKYRYKVLTGDLRLRVRELIAQVAEELGVQIVNGVLSSDHLHLFVAIPPDVSVSEFVKRTKGRSSGKIHQEFAEINKRYWGGHFWGRGYFSSPSGNVTDEVINASLNNHAKAHPINHEENMSLDCPRLPAGIINPTTSVGGILSH